MMIPKPGKHKKRKRPGNDKKHLTNIRLLHCAACQSSNNVEAHHLKAGTGERGMGMRSSDKWAIPLCSDCHRGPVGVEMVGSKKEPAWMRERGISALILADKLWAAKDDLEAMRDVMRQNWKWIL